MVRLIVASSVFAITCEASECGTSGYGYNCYGYGYQCHEEVSASDACSCEDVCCNGINFGIKFGGWMLVSDTSCYCQIGDGDYGTIRDRRQQGRCPTDGHNSSKTAAAMLMGGHSNGELQGSYHIKDSTQQCLTDSLSFAECTGEATQTWDFVGDNNVVRSATKGVCIQAEAGGEWGSVTLEECDGVNAAGQQWSVTAQNQLSANVEGCYFRSLGKAPRGKAPLMEMQGGCCLERLDSTVKLWSCDGYGPQIWTFETAADENATMIA